MCSSKFMCYRVRHSPSEALEPPSFLAGFRITLGLVLVAGLVFTTSLLVMASSGWCADPGVSPGKNPAKSTGAPKTANVAKTSDAMNTANTPTANAGKAGSAEKASKAEKEKCPSYSIQIPNDGALSFASQASQAQHAPRAYHFQPQPTDAW